MCRQLYFKRGKHSHRSVLTFAWFFFLSPIQLSYFYYFWVCVHFISHWKSAANYRMACLADRSVLGNRTCSSCQLYCLSFIKAGHGIWPVFSAFAGKLLSDHVNSCVSLSLSSWVSEPVYSEEILFVLHSKPCCVVNMPFSTRWWIILSLLDMFVVLSLNTWSALGKKYLRYK